MGIKLFALFHVYSHFIKFRLNIQYILTTHNFQLNYLMLKNNINTFLWHYEF